MKKIKIAQIGVGHDHAISGVGSLKQLPDLFDVIGYAVVENDDSNPCANINHPNYDGIPKMTVEEILSYPDLDAVLIETEDRNLTKYAIMAAEKGLHIQMDKPGSQSQEEFEQLITLVKEKNLIFQTGYMYRYHPAIKDAIKRAKSGELGTIYAVEAHMDCEHTIEKRKWLKKYQGGMMAFLGCHLVDLIYQIQGEPEKIFPLNTCTEPELIDGAEDYGMVVFRYKNGISFAKTCANEPGGFIRRQLVICGTKGTLELRPLEYYTDGLISTDTYESFSGNAWGNTPKKSVSVPQDRYLPMLKGFAAMIHGEYKNPYSYDYEQKLHSLVLKSCGF
ncbi:MAG: Gfo/Idh/MocA family oxidoreductase [Ruminococcaceae bacterium]|nr:Gfo/Idh/MocA family oxidoreductase [Oscillospiraceae bacterium]